MIEKFEDLNDCYQAVVKMANEKYVAGTPMKHTDFIEIMHSSIGETIGCPIVTMQEKLCEYVKENAGKMAKTLEYLAENNDWDHCSEEVDEIEKSILRGATKPESWVLSNFIDNPDPSDHVLFEFTNKFINDGRDFNGCVCVSYAGAVKHFFVLSVK